MTRESRIGLEAAAWVVKFDGVEFVERDVRAFRRWLARSPNHRDAFNLASRTWTELDLLERLETYPLPPTDEAAFSRRHALALAGLGAVAVGGGAVFLRAGNAQALETRIGERRTLTLVDKTRVTLNAATRIETDRDPLRRTARLVAGEALFSIAPAVEAFVIRLPYGSVTAMRGDVLVKLLPEGARVSLMTAHAQAQGDGWFARAAPVDAAAQSEIVFAPNGVDLKAAAPERLTRRLLWREGWIAFDDAPLSEAAADVTRQSGVRFVFADPDLARVRVGGLVRADDLDAFLALLRDNLAIVAERRDGRIILRAARAP